MGIKNSCRGITLIEMSVVLAMLIAGWSLLSFLPWQQSFLTFIHTSVTRQRAHTIYMALLNSVTPSSVVISADGTHVTLSTDPLLPTHITITQDPTDSTRYHLHIQNGTQPPTPLSMDLSSASFSYFNAWGESVVLPDDIRVIGITLEYQSYPYTYYIGLRP